MRRLLSAQLVVLAMGLGALGACTPTSQPRNPEPPTATASVEPMFHRLVVAPGRDPSVLPVNVDGAQLIEIDRTGALLVHHGPSVKRQQRPRAYQDIGGRRREVSVRFEIAAAGPPRLAVGLYDSRFPLVIDSDKRGAKP